VAERLRGEVGQLRRAMETQRLDVDHRQRTLAQAQRAFEVRDKWMRKYLKRYL
jgi:hypothetical protein